MLEWIQSWTFFNWLAIVAFLLAIVGFLNSFLGLRTRFRDWKAVRNKESLKKRLLDLEHQAVAAKVYNHFPTQLIIQIFYRSLTIVKAIAFNLVLMILMSLWSLYSGNSLRFTFFSALLFSFMIPLWFYIFAEKSETIIGNFYQPENLAIKSQTLIEQAKKLGIIEELDIKNITELIREKSIKDMKNQLEKLKTTVENIPLPKEKKHLKEEDPLNEDNSKEAS